MDDPWLFSDGGDDDPPKSRWVMAGMHHLFDTEESLSFRHFMEISNTVMDGYAQFVRNGLPGQAIGLCMLGATVNLYDMFEMREELPALLRDLAERLEHESHEH